nr:immunoglobulin heavy chain junction region [Homo sapiens]
GPIHHLQRQRQEL